MAQYEVTAWIAHARGEPQIVTTVEANSAAEAMVRVLRSAGVPGASKVEVSTADGLLLWRWRLVILLSGSRFMYQHREAQSR